MKRFTSIAVAGVLAIFASYSATAQTGSTSGTGTADAAGAGQATEAARAQNTQTQPGTAAQDRLGVQGRGSSQVQPGAGLRGEQQRMSNYGRFRQRPWFDNSDVRQQLGINDDQYNRLNQGYGTAWNRYRQGVSGLNNLDATARQQRMQELERDFDRGFSQNVDSVLTDQERRNRYNQLQNQYRGYTAFEDPTLRQSLNLTTGQQQQLSRLAREREQNMRQLQRQYRQSPETASTQYRQFQDQYWNRLGTVLNEQQLQSWQQSVGDRYDFPPETYWDDDTPRTAQQPGERTDGTGNQPDDATGEQPGQPRNPTPQQ